MTGAYTVSLYNNKVRYELAIRRNITILQGNSATGKTELIRLLSLYNSNPASSGITLLCEKTCTVLTEENWRLFTASYNNRIFFADEGNGFLKTKEFADTVKFADNYFVIITRESLPQLPYSVDEIYGLREDRESEKYRVPRRVYNEMFRIYGSIPSQVLTPDIIITEDSNSGFEFFQELFPGKCISSQGKSNMKKAFAEHVGESILAIVDGAAFGPEMAACMEYAAISGDAVSIYAPESFEFLILSSGLIEVSKRVLDETWEYADSVQYFSWEEFYTHYLALQTQNQVSQYSKKKLNAFYKTLGSIEKIRDVLPACIQDLL